MHVYINPEREIDAGAQEIHGLSSEFLADKPVFADILSDFTNFIGDDLLVIHNAPFDIGFLNAELSRCGHPPLSMDRVVDTLPLARQKYPGAQVSLDALCRRFGVDNSHRDLHGALIDADLLAAVYVELQGGRQPGLQLGEDTGQHAPETASPEDTDLSGFILTNKPVRPARSFTLPEQEAADHQTLIERMDNPIWLR
ncbi:MAG: DNA polymerase III subunit epsilon [Pseudomonadota bacterium]|nr:DNA polymerase III subunit epsilon [Pseudomonadota bacterium]